MEQVLTLDAVSFFKEVREMQKETERRFQETERRFQETERRFQETERLMKERSEETERLMKQQSQETDKRIGKLGNRLGEFIEEMVRPGAIRLFRERGINVHVVSRNVTAERDGEAAEIDLLVVNDGEMIVVECKSSLSIDDVNEHLERLGKIKRLFPHYRDMKVMGAVAAMVIPENVGKYAYKKVFFVLCQSGDNMVIPLCQERCRLR
ncbi:MAG: DUF3782 domain-containing protein [Desulfamplus sp.]|nr:DUF3782 domain-containing protein [Desulfamplus sp.]